LSNSSRIQGQYIQKLKPLTKEEKTRQEIIGFGIVIAGALLNTLLHVGIVGGLLILIGLVIALNALFAKPKK